MLPRRVRAGRRTYRLGPRGLGLDALAAQMPQSPGEEHATLVAFYIRFIILIFYDVSYYECVVCTFRN